MKAWSLLVGCLALLAGSAAADGTLPDFAKKYKVSVDEVHSMLDSGLTWADVGDALAIAQKAGVPPSDVTELHKAGLSWEQTASKYGFKLGDVSSSARKIEADGRRAEAAQGAAASPTEPAPLSRLAAHYRVSERELVSLREQGMGWSEIGHAVAIAEKSGEPLNDVVDLRKSGLDWSQIAGRFGFTLSDVGDEAKSIEEQGRAAERTRRAP
jgi:hypothetical protein